MAQEQTVLSALVELYEVILFAAFEMTSLQDHIVSWMVSLSLVVLVTKALELVAIHIDACQPNLPGCTNCKGQ